MASKYVWGIHLERRRGHLPYAILMSVLVFGLFRGYYCHLLRQGMDTNFYQTFMVIVTQFTRCEIPKQSEIPSSFLIG
jgi:hypothetical protein